MNLEECRVKIDEIDSQLVKLLEERMDVVRQVAGNKAKTGKAVLDASREEQKLEKIRQLSQEEYADYNVETFQHIMAVSRKFQSLNPIQYGLLGEHLGHSFSPEIHRALGGYQYALFEVEPENLEDFIRKSSVKGFNVTIPYKKAVIPYLDKLSEIAAELGSVNCVVKDDEGRLTGYNTDYYGFVKMVELADIDVSGSKAIVLGDGGVAPTVRLALKNMGASEIVTISRRGENNYENLDRHFDAEIIVNTTPVGMYPNNGQAQVNIDDFSSCRAVIDLIYNPLKTKLMLDAEAKGIATSCGLDMLVYQAARAAELFTGAEIPEEKTQAVLERMKAQSMNIVLIGMPGCGKSRIGKEIANILNMPFLDADAEIQKRTDTAPGDIIREQGEDAFRKIESEVVADLGAMHGAVIATGGGVVTRAENYQPLAQNGIIIYINRPVEDLKTSGRPLSQARTPQVIFEERREMYESWNDMEAEVLETPVVSAQEIIRRLGR